MLEWLKNILGSGYTDEIDKQVSQEIGKIFVSKADFNTKSEALKAAEKTVKERDSQLEALKASSGDADALKRQIETLQTQNIEAKKTYEAELAKIRLDGAVDTALSSVGARNPKLLKGALDMSKVSLDGENLKGLTEQIEAIKKTDAYLFNEESKPQTATLPMFLHRKPQKQLTYTVSFDIIKA